MGTAGCDELVSRRRKRRRTASSRSTSVAVRRERAALTGCPFSWCFSSGSATETGVLLSSHSSCNLDSVPFAVNEENCMERRNHARIAREFLKHISVTFLVKPTVRGLCMTFNWRM